MNNANGNRFVQHYRTLRPDREFSRCNAMSTVTGWTEHQREHQFRRDLVRVVSTGWGQLLLNGSLFEMFDFIPVNQFRWTISRLVTSSNQVNTSTAVQPSPSRWKERSSNINNRLRNAIFQINQQEIKGKPIYRFQYSISFTTVQIFNKLVAIKDHRWRGPVLIKTINTSNLHIWRILTLLLSPYAALSNLKIGN